MLIEMVKKLVQMIAPKFGTRDTYKPERHYMRGPGPKSKQIDQTKARSPQPGEPDQVEA